MFDRNGQSLVQLLLVIALTAIAMPALITGFVTSRSGKAQQSQRLQAHTHILEMQEAVRSIRDADWENIAVNNTYHPVLSGNEWTLASGSEVIDGFQRELQISEVLRDTNGDIVASGGFVDPSTKRIDFTVSWNTPYSSQISSQMYLTRHENISYTETTEEQFNAGTPTGVTIDSEYDGEVILGGGGQGNWCEPNLSIQALDLPKNGVANAISAVEGRAHVGTGDNASGVSYANVTIGDSNPPVATVSGTFDCCKTNDIYGVDDTVYIATDTNAKEVTMFDIGGTPYSEIGYFDAPGPHDATSVFASGTIGYMTQVGGDFITFDADPNSGPSKLQLGSIQLSGTGNDIQVIGDYAYVAVDSTSVQLQILDVSDPASPTVIASTKTGSVGAKALYVNQTATRAYLATEASASEREMYIIDLSAPGSSKPVLGSYDTQGMDPKGVTVVTNNRAIVIGNGGQEYQVVSITNETAPFQCGGLDVDTGINGVASVLEADGDAYSYIITGDQTAEFKIIEGGPGSFSTEGTFQSATFDAGADTIFNRISANISLPSQTDLTLQIAITDPVLGSCSGATFDYIGPDGTNGTYFTSEDDTTIIGVVPFDNDDSGFENPGRCVRYKAYLSTSDATQTPVLYDVTINYAP